MLDLKSILVSDFSFDFIPLVDSEMSNNISLYWVFAPSLTDFSQNVILFTDLYIRGFHNKNTAMYAVLNSDSSGQIQIPNSLTVTESSILHYY